MELVANIIHKPVPNIPTSRMDSSPGIWDIIRKCSTKSPADRHNSFGEIGLALRRLRTGGNAATTGEPEHNPLQQPTIAILPLLNLTGQPSDDVIGVGIAEIMTASLGAFSDLKVLPRHAGRNFAGPDRDLKKAAAELGSTLLIDGSFQRLRERLRVSLSIVNPDNLSIFWSTTIDGQTDETFSLQTELAETIASVLQLRLGLSAKDNIGKRQTANSEAFADYVQAQSFADRVDVPGNFERAEEMFRRAISKDPRFGLAYAGLGNLFRTRFRATKETGWLMKASEQLLEALRLAPEQPDIRFTLASVYRDTGRVDAARQELRGVLLSKPNHDEAHQLIGLLLIEAGEIDDGLREIKTAIHLRPHFWRHHLQLGSALYGLGRYADAIDSCKRAVELQPDNAWGYQVLGTAKYAIGDVSDALAAFERANEIAPTASAFTNIGTIYYQRGNFSAALNAHVKAVELMPSNPVNHRNLGDTLKRMGRATEAHTSYSQALACTDRILEANSHDGITWSRKAVLHAKLGHSNDALASIDRALQLRGQEVEVLYRKGVVYALVGRKEDAVTAVVEAIRAGYSTVAAIHDDDLELIHNDPQIRSLLSSTNEHKQKTGGVQ
jgi:tetratricopeptide (TPR) repeat protein